MRKIRHTIPRLLLLTLAFLLVECRQSQNQQQNSNDAVRSADETTAREVPTPVALYGWSCKQRDAAETGFRTVNAAEIAAAIHREKGPGHETTVSEVVASASDSEQLTIAKRQIDLLLPELQKVAEKSQLNVPHRDLNVINQAAAELKAVMAEADNHAALVRSLSLADLAALRTYEGSKIEPIAQQVAEVNRSIYREATGSWRTSGPFSMMSVAPQTLMTLEPIDHKSIDCGVYGPYHAEANCPAYTQHAYCWCDKQILGWGVAKCECRAGGAVSAPPPPPPEPDQTCSIPVRQYACNLNGAGVSGTDFGCRVACNTGYKGVCRENICEPGRWTPSMCVCIPK